MPCITKETFCRPLGLRRERFDLPEYGDGSYVNVQALSARDLVYLRKQYGTTGDSDNLAFVFDVLALGLVNDDGSPLFEHGEEVQTSLNVSIERMQGMAEQVCQVSGIGAKKNSDQANPSPSS